MSGDRSDSGGFILESELFPAFRKRGKLRQAMNEEMPAPSLPDRPPEQETPAEYKTEQKPPVGYSAEREAESLLNDPSAGAAPPEAVEDTEPVPALFGDISLEKFRKQAEEEQQPDREPTLLEFLNEPLDQSAVPPPLFEGIENLFPSDEVLRLASEQEEIEAEELRRQEAELAARSGEEEPHEPEEPAPEPEELFDMISSIFRQQREDWDRHVDGILNARQEKKDPYNTAFNSRSVVINYDNIGELPLEDKYKLSQITEQEEAALRMKHSQGPDAPSRRAQRGGLHFNRRGRHS